MNTTKLKIQLYGSYFLRRKALPVERVNEEIRDILCQMLQLMYTHKGIGLAANQVGILKRLIVIDIGRGPLKMINPCILKKKGEVCIEEGCLSLPQTNVKVKRARSIEVEYLNEKGKVSYLKAVDLLSICIQHEIDHLEGRLIIDYLPFFKRCVEKIKLKRRVKEYEAKMS